MKRMDRNDETVGQRRLLIFIFFIVITESEILNRCDGMAKAFMDIISYLNMPNALNPFAVHHIHDGGETLTVLVR